MAKPNKQFELDVEDIDVIETALRSQLFSVTTSMQQKKDINEVLGKLHHQKIWYRPSNSAYVGG
jgi:predicted RNA-binding protein associated with RNAse of E/G family